MPYSNDIFQEAQRIVSGAKERQARAQKEKLRLQDQISDLEAEIEQNKLASDRLSTFQAERDGREQCPRCWIAEEVRADLTTLTGDDRHDKFRCTRCRNEYVFSF